jgi:hypothetical protein
MPNARNPIVDSIRVLPRQPDFLERKVGTRGEIFFDDQDIALRLYDGNIPGGIALLRADLENLEGSLGAVVSATPPIGPQPGTIWFNSTNGRQLIYFNTVWVQPTPSLYSQGGTQTSLTFPVDPEINDTFTNGIDTWIWLDTYWGVKNLVDPEYTDLTVTNTITGSVSDISNHNLNDLGNVAALNPENGAVLAYNTESESWESITLTSTFNGGTITNPLIINNNNSSTSTTSGALRVTGGLGVGGAVNVGTYIDLKTRGELRFSDADNSNYVSFKAPASVASNITWTLPGNDGSSGQVLSTNGSGVLSWATASGSGGGESNPPGGLDSAVQFNNSGTFGGSSSLTFNAETSTLTSASITVTASTVSTTTTTGSLVAAGGVGIAGQLNVGGTTNKFTAATSSSSTTTGAMVIAGGAGIGGNVNVGGTVNIETAPTSSTHAATKGYVDSNVLAFSIAFGV